MALFHRKRTADTADTTAPAATLPSSTRTPRSPR